VSIDTGLIGHWPLAADCEDHSGNGNHGQNHGADLAVTGPDGRTSGAAFNGRGAGIEVPSSDSLALGDSDFSISVRVHTDEELDSVLGDILSKYDPDDRTGFNLGLMCHAGVTAAQSNHRHVHFGIDSGQAGEWTDCGRPGNNLRVYSLAVFEGDLYAGTFETGAAEAGHLYRYAGGAEWVDCGRPDRCNTVASLAVYKGRLYAGSSRYKAGGSALPDSENQNPGGNMYRYEAGSEWTSVGHLEGADSVAGMAVYRGQLYAIPLYSQGVFRYDGGDTWTHCGGPGKRMMSLSVFDGHLYGAGNEGEGRGGVYRYEGGTEWSSAGHQEGVNQVYSFAVHNGRIHVGTWPEGKVFRDDGEPMWTSVGRLGEELEVMAMAVFNGKLYAGTLPLGQVYRHDGGDTWTLTGQLDRTADVKYRRVWSMAVFQGKLFGGTLPSGRVYSLEAGRSVTHDRELAPGWRHLAAIRDGGGLRLYVDGALVATSSAFNAVDFWLSNDRPLRIGSGPHSTFHGRIGDLRLYDRPLTDREVTELGSLS
jgi:hypothetical protein